MYAYTLFTRAARLHQPPCLGTILPRTSPILAGNGTRFGFGWAAQVGSVDARPFGGTQPAPGQFYAKEASPKG
jgi:hypothetical protein